jgi:hydroxymethylpyrimidine pyrophosphatase-like HAD family hydrolase
MPRPIATLDADEARDLHGLLFDLDDTILDCGRLAEPAYGALFRLREAGLHLLAVTGRPAGYGSVLARQWPVAAVVAENGAVALVRDGSAVRVLDPLGAEARPARRARLLALAGRLRARFPELVPTDDLDPRITDVTFDIGERCHAAPDLVAAAVRHAQTLGLCTTVSSVHLHVTLDGDDKASGVVRTLGVLLGTDPTEARFRYAFMGDSDNDAPCWAAFRTTIAPANFVGRPTILPRFVTRGERGAGFAEAAEVVVARRRWH